MHSQHVLLLLGLAWLAQAVPTPAPLNINLGAYSPALVVGDGEISFGGGEAAGEEAAAAEPAQVDEAAQVGEGAQVADNDVEATSQTTVGEDPTAEQDTSATTQDTTLLQGMGKQRLPKN